MEPNIKRKKFKIEGMTCVNCENKIERKLNKTAGIQVVNVSYNNGTCMVTFDSDVILQKDIIKVIEQLEYKVLQEDTGKQDSDLSKLLGSIAIIYVAYTFMRHFGLFNIFNIFPQAEAGMGYGMLFLIGILTSVHCVAMCGGINLSQCISHGANGCSSGRFTSLHPSFLYNIGRVISYTVIGGLVGALGSVISFSGAAKGLVQIIAGLFMVIMGLNMLNIFPWLRKFNPRMPKFFAAKIHAEKSSNSSLYVGLLNGLMPCGPLQAMQLYALSTGSPMKGALSMFLFSLGTVPLMFGLGALSSILSQKFTKRVLSVGAVLVVILGASMFNSGVSLSGFTITTAAPAKTTKDNQAEIKDGVQMITTSLQTRRYEPITVQAGIPVQWTITAEQGSINGCNNRMVIKEYGIEKKFEFGDNIIEFTPTKAGTFTYSCWMGMIRSTITVLAEGEALPEIAPAVETIYDDLWFDDLGIPSEPEPANYKIPVDEVIVADIVDGIQYVSTEFDGTRFAPAILIMQYGIETKWQFKSENLTENQQLLLFPLYETVIELQTGEDDIYIFPVADFDFSTIDYRAYGYVKVVEDITDIDIEAIKAEVAEYETYKWDYNNIGGGASCH